MSHMARAAMVLLCALIMACSQRGASPATPGPASNQRDSVIVLVPALPNSLDPWSSSAELTAPFIFNVFDTLTLRDRSFAVRPGLVSEWRLIDDLTWELSIRSGARTHGGESITAELVVRSLERSRTLSLSSEDVRSWPILDGVDTTAAVSDRTVRVRTLWPMPELPLRLSEAPISGSDADPTRSATGPLRVASWTPGRRLELEAWSEYWLPAGPIRKLTFIAEASEAERFNRLQRGEADIITQLDPTHLAAAKAGPTTEETATLGPRVFYLGLTPLNSASPLARREVRRALADSINLPDIGTRVFNDQAIVVPDLMPVLGVAPSVVGPDIGAAQARLASLGVTGSSIDLMIPDGRFSHDAALGNALMQAITAAGFQVQRLPVSWSQITSGVTPTTLDRAYLGAWENRVYDPMLGLTELVLGMATLDAPTRQSLEAAMSRSKGMADPDQRTAIVNGARATLNDQTVAIPLFQSIDLYGTRRGLKWQARVDQRILLSDVGT